MIFVYSAKQEDLAGTDGLISFRRVFRGDARLVLILHRSGWGQTPWTRVEMEAITDRLLKEGPSFLFVVSLDSSPPPPWVPDKLIRFSLKDFGIEQLVGAIKARALEVGSAFHQPDIAAHATQAAEAIAFANERAALHRSTEGVQLSTAEVQRLFALIAENLQQAKAASPSLGIEFGATEEFLAARAGRGGVIVGYSLQWSNVLESAYSVKASRRCEVGCINSHGKRDAASSTMRRLSSRLIAFRSRVRAGV
jgi:hypothetical protein